MKKRILVTMVDKTQYYADCSFKNIKEHIINIGDLSYLNVHFQYTSDYRIYKIKPTLLNLTFIKRIEEQDYNK